MGSGLAESEEKEVMKFKKKEPFTARRLCGTEKVYS